MYMISICVRNKYGDFKDNIVFMKKTQDVYTLQRTLEQNPDIQIAVVSCKSEYDGRLYINQHLKFADLISIFNNFDPNLEFVLDIANEMAINSSYREFVYKLFLEEIEKKYSEIEKRAEIDELFMEKDDKLVSSISELTKLVKNIIQENVKSFEQQSSFGVIKLGSKYHMLGGFKDGQSE